MALRDPFMRPAGMLYQAYGCINGTQNYFALLVHKGSCYRVKQGDSILGFVVKEITKERVVLKDQQQRTITLSLEKKALQLR